MWLYLHDENNMLCKISDTGFLFSIDNHSSECGEEMDWVVLQSFVTLGHAFEQYTVNYMANLCSHFREQKSWSFTQVNFEILASAADALLLYL